MKELNQNQLILLVLLITFVTSIATGIMTVSLLQEAPVEVTRNINQIVEKTIETIVPVNVGMGTKNKEVTTVVVKEDDLIVSSVDKNIKSIVRISEEDSSLGLRSFYGIGIVIAKDGTLISDRKTISSGNIYYAKFNDDSEYKLVPLGVDKKTGSILFRVNLPEKVGKDFYPVKMSASDPQLGQTIIGIGGETKNTVIVGRVSTLSMKESSTGSTTVKYLSSVETDMPLRDFVPGGPFFNLSGDLVGLKLSIGTSSFIPISIINKEIKSIQE